MNENAKLLADLFCLMQGTNAAFAKNVLGTWLYKDGVVVHNLQAIDSEHNGHLEAFSGKLAHNKITIREFSRCECHQCWVAILNGSSAEAIKSRELVWQSAFECMGLPPVALTLDIQPPDFPSIRQHVAFISSLQKHGLLRCARMVREGQCRAKV